MTRPDLRSVHRIHPSDKPSTWATVLEHTDDGILIRPTGKPALLVTMQEWAALTAN